MKSFIRCVVAFLVALAPLAALAQNPSGDPLQSLLVPPEVLFQHREKIGLSEEQVEQVRSRLEGAAAQVQEHETQLKESMGKLVQLLSADQVDEQAALNELNRVLAAEKELKQLHMRLLIQVRNNLTVEQRRVAAQLAQAATAPGVPDHSVEHRLKFKISRIEKEVQARAQAGQPPFEAVGFMQKLPELMQNGQVREAEALLDRVLAMLGLNNSDKGDVAPAQAGGPAQQIAAKIRQVQQLAQQKQQQGEDISEIRQVMERISTAMKDGRPQEAEQMLNQLLRQLHGAAPRQEVQPRSNQPKSAAPKKSENSQSRAEPLPLDQLVAKVESLREEKVAWREIAWTPCLLDGLKTSHQEKKPMVLWIFIDRPIDDERC